MKAKAVTVAPGERFSLDRIDPDDTGGFRDKRNAARHLARSLARLHELQEVLYAEAKHALLVILQGIDTAGKDGTIAHVLSACNPQGVQITPFKVPTPQELAHDFLWRVHHAVPAHGMIGIFNRSHYEDVLVVRVHHLVPQRVWRRRFEHINAFEKLLADSGVVLVKLFLWISRDEQAKRLRAREKDPAKQWKLSPTDLKERTLWDEYVPAYEDALSRCNTAHAPWHVVPANHKWYRNLVVSELLVEKLEKLHLRYPKPGPGVTDLPIPD
jgi:PPK2 family polyphosphate:nucleotide phosphotransferase